jgi:hypothetical protein
VPAPILRVTVREYLTLHQNPLAKNSPAVTNFNLSVCVPIFVIPFSLLLRGWP